jgi:hypothetical protein
MLVHWCLEAGFIGADVHKAYKRPHRQEFDGKSKSRQQLESRPNEHGSQRENNSCS